MSLDHLDFDLDGPAAQLALLADAAVPCPRCDRPVLVARDSSRLLARTGPAGDVDAALATVVVDAAPSPDGTHALAVDVDWPASLDLVITAIPASAGDRHQVHGCG